jgi:hypothetical protein
VIEVRGFLLLNQVFEDADILSLRNFDGEHLLAVVAMNKTVEREKLGGIEYSGRLNLF